ncbi:MAG: hypothetical protein HY885_04035 [Deltaproteobacteria bacterium]|nr:hypothetical protein [Deltaproteobacteria bacterium]
MTTQFDIDCALIAGVAYRSTRDQINRIPPPDGWTEVPLSHLTMPSGFEAVSFQRNNEIVISFAGTNAEMLDPDWIADFTLTTGLACSQQLKEAAAYFLEIKKANQVNQNITYTFTGHSLGGGLSALLGVFFGEKAVTFDQAPFAGSAKESIRNELVAYLLGLKDADQQPVYTQAQLDVLAPALFSFSNAGLAARQQKVSGFYVEGEFLSSSVALQVFSTIGHQTPIIHGAEPDNLAFEFSLHSQSLLTAFLMNDDFRQVTEQLPDMVKMLFDELLFAYPTDKENTQYVNFLEHLIQHDGDHMLDRFTADLQLIVQSGGRLDESEINRALVAFAMQAYYDNRLASDATLFEEFSGGLRFSRTGVADTLAEVKGFTGTDLDRMFTSYLDSLAYNSAKTALTQQLPDLLDWHIQAGSQGMDAMAGDERAFMLGGSSADHHIGGSQGDVLVGNGGKDILHGGFVRDGETNTYRSLSDNNFTITFNSPGHLVLNSTDSVTFANQTSAADFESGNFGITLFDPAEVDLVLTGTSFDDDTQGLVFRTSTGSHRGVYCFRGTVNPPGGCNFMDGYGEFFLTGDPPNLRIDGGEGNWTWRIAA